MHANILEFLSFAAPRRGLMAIAAMGALALGGCGLGGIDGVELQGGVFDALGVSSKTEVKPSQQKVAARPGLVLPPAEDRLPPPGEVQPVEVAGTEAWPVDPEESKNRNRAEKERQHREFCEVALRNARLKQETGVVMGPMGNCQPGMFGSLTNVIEGKKGQ